MAQVIVRRNQEEDLELSDSTKYILLKEYSEGLSSKDLAIKYKLPPKPLEKFLSKTANTLIAMSETRRLVTGGAIAVNTKTPVAMMNKEWLEEVPNQVEVYAYYYATTGSNEYALEESSLAGYLPSATSAKAKKFILNARGRYLRAIPEVNEMINLYRDQRVKDADVGSNLVQSELLQQLEELKETVDESPRNRGHILKTIELLGKTEGVFSDTMIIDDISTKTGMDKLMENIKNGKKEE